MKIKDLVRMDAEYYRVDLGTHVGWFWNPPYNDEDMFCFEYEIGGEEFGNWYPTTKEGVENALWEWFCTLSRATTPDWSRTLGSKRAFDAA